MILKKHEPMAEGLCPKEEQIPNNLKGKTD
jgi:hypothetical protein